MTTSDTHADTIRERVRSGSVGRVGRVEALAALDALVDDRDRERARADRAEAALRDVREWISTYTDCDCDEDSICLVHRVGPIIDAALSAGSGGQETTT